MQKDKLLVFYNYPSSFVLKDIALLQSGYEVVSHDFFSKQKWKLPLRFIAQKLFILRHIFSSKLLLCQLAGYHTILPVLFGLITNKRVFVVIGGAEGHNFPGIGYGATRKALHRLAIHFSLRFCTRILPKHHTLMAYDYHYDRHEPSRQGVENIFGIHKPYAAIPNGFDAEQFKPGTAKPNSFATLCMGWGFPFQVQLKGIDLFVEAARRFPQYEFAIIGIDRPDVIKNPPPNLILAPPTGNKDLGKVLGQYEFYMQLSMAEGFPNSLCEAMLCGCIPIVSEAFSMPEIIGNSGFVLHERNPEMLFTLIEQAIATPNKSTRRQQARQLIMENYTLEKRQKLLLEALKS